MNGEGYARRTTEWLTCAALATVCFGCADESGTRIDSPAAYGAIGTVTDSLGVRRVQHALPAYEDSRAVYALLSDQATQRISDVPRAEQAELHQVTGVALGEQGQLIVGHGSLKELLIFDSNANNMIVAGRLGSGPGEFRSLRGPWVMNDNRVAAYDASLRRTTIFSLDGTMDRVQNVRGAKLPDSLSSVWQSFGVTTNGISLLWADGPRPEVIGMARPLMSIVAMDSIGAFWKVGEDRDGLERYAMPPTGDGFVSLGLSPLAATPLAAPCGERLVFADNQSYTATLLDLDGAAEMVVRADVPRREATDNDFRAALLARDGEGRVRESEIPIMRMMTPSGLLPVLKSVLCDSAMNIWVEEWPHADGALTRLSSYSQTGARRFSVLLSANMRLLTVSPDAVVLAVRDEDGVEHIELRTVQAEP